jgi:methylglutamate dehydrogenase subunit D
MLDAHSPLGAAAQFESNSVKLSEASGFALVQVAGDEKVLKKTFGKLPTKIGTVLHQDDQTLFRIGPKQFWLLGKTVLPSEGVYVTPLSSGRTRIALEGANARRVLAACALIDFDASQFKPGNFVMTGIHHTPVIIHCTGENSFHVYALRTFALNIWEWLCDVTEGLKNG